MMPIFKGIVVCARAALGTIVAAVNVETNRLRFTPGRVSHRMRCTCVQHVAYRRSPPLRPAALPAAGTRTHPRGDGPESGASHRVDACAGNRGTRSTRHRARGRLDLDAWDLVRRAGSRAHVGARMQRVRRANGARLYGPV